MAAAIGHELERDHRSLDRLVAFSDGVFAIAITLLVLNLRLADITTIGARPPLWPQLVDLAPNLFGFALSFVVIGGYWMSHHRVFRYVERVDTRTMWLSMLVLFFVALLPFPTAIVADYGDTTLGVLVYATTMVATGLAMTGLVLYVYGAKLVSSDANRRVAVVRSLVTPAVFAMSIPVAFFSPSWASMMWWLVAVAYFVVDPLVNSDWGRLRPKGKKAS